MHINLGAPFPPQNILYHKFELSLLAKVDFFICNISVLRMQKCITEQEMQTLFTDDKPDSYNWRHPLDIKEE